MGELGCFMANHTAMEPLHSHQVTFQRKCCNNFPGYRNLPMLHLVPLSDQREEVVMEQYQVYLCCLNTNIHIKRLSVRIAFYTTMNKDARSRYNRSIQND